MPVSRTVTFAFLPGSYWQHMPTYEQELLAGRPVGVSSDGIASHDEAGFAGALLAALRPAFPALGAIGLSDDDAADVLQDASIQAWRHRSQRHREVSHER